MVYNEMPKNVHHQRHYSEMLVRQKTKVIELSGARLFA